MQLDLHEFLKLLSQALLCRCRIAAGQEIHDSQLEQRYSVLTNRWIASELDGQFLLAQTAAAGNDSFLQILFSGGVLGVGIMILLLLLSVLAGYLIIDQSLSLRRQNVIPEASLETIRQLLAQGKLKEADAVCHQQPSPFAFIVSSGLSEVEFGWASVEKAMEESTAEQASRLYRRIEYLSVLGNIAPMLGLLGTVGGMIVAFRQVAASQGTAGAADLAQGIYSALVTTVAGLLIAIPSLGAFAILRNRVDQLISETIYAAQHVFQPIRRRMPGSLAIRAPMVPPTQK